jgi:hypothetical protein
MKYTESVEMIGVNITGVLPSLAQETYQKVTAPISEDRNAIRTPPMRLPRMYTSHRPTAPTRIEAILYE